MLAHDIIATMFRDERLKAALEEIRDTRLADTMPEVSTKATARLSDGTYTVRVTIAIVPDGEMFADEL